LHFAFVIRLPRPFLDFFVLAQYLPK
jgi:hypothetical protein